jgi:hypothetical protein
MDSRDYLTMVPWHPVQLRPGGYQELYGPDVDFSTGNIIGHVDSRA